MAALQEAIDAYNAAKQKKVPAEILATMPRCTEDLKPADIEGSRPHARPRQPHLHRPAQPRAHKHTATTQISPPSLHDALPILPIPIPTAPAADANTIPETNTKL